MQACISFDQLFRFNRFLRTTLPKFFSALPEAGLLPFAKQYADPELKEPPEDLMKRGGAYYSTVATQLLNADADLVTIQDLLGHNWITTTQRYCRISNVKVQRDYFKAMRTITQRSDRQLGALPGVEKRERKQLRRPMPPPSGGGIGNRG